MKFTEKYIKMCDTPEIQDNWKPEVGDWCINFSKVQVTSNTRCLSNSSCKYVDEHKRVYTHLPLQHQLIEMYNGKHGKGEDGSLWGLCFDLKEFAYENEYCDDGNTLRFTSMEELILGLYMFTDYQKKWNNTKGVWFNGN